MRTIGLRRAGRPRCRTTSADSNSLAASRPSPTHTPSPTPVIQRTPRYPAPRAGGRAGRRRATATTRPSVHHQRLSHVVGLLWNSDVIYKKYIYWLCRRAASRRGERVNKGVIQFGELITAEGPNWTPHPTLVFRNAKVFRSLSLTPNPSVLDPAEGTRQLPSADCRPRSRLPPHVAHVSVR